MTYSSTGEDCYSVQTETQQTTQRDVTLRYMTSEIQVHTLPKQNGMCFKNFKRYMRGLWSSTSSTTDSLTESKMK